MLPSNYCSNCYRVFFDDSLSGLKGVKEDKIEKDELYRYLSTHNYSNSQTYSQYFFKTNDIEGLKKAVADNQGVSSVSFGTIDIGKTYFIVMGITSDISTWKWVALGGIGGVFILPLVVGSAGLGVLVLGATVGGVGAGAIGSEISGLFNPEVGAIVVPGDNIKNDFMTPTIQEANSKKYDALKCEEVLTYD